MTEKKHALLLFSKPPVPGMVKTRLTTKHGGFLSEVAGGRVLQAQPVRRERAVPCTRFWSCRPKTTRLVAADPDVGQDHLRLLRVHHAGGKRGADARDLRRHWPVAHGDTLPHRQGVHVRRPLRRRVQADIRAGLRAASCRWAATFPPCRSRTSSRRSQWLDYFQGLGTPGFVQAPCQECGTSLVGFSRNTPIDHQGVYYNLNGRAALDAYVEKLQEKDIPSAYFSPVADIDEKTDLAHAISCMRAIEAASKHQTDLFVPRRVLDWVDYMGIQVSTPAQRRTRPAAVHRRIEVPPACRLRRPANANQRIKVTMMKVLHKTTALCPDVLARAACERVRRRGRRGVDGAHLSRPRAP